MLYSVLLIAHYVITKYYWFPNEVTLQKMKTQSCFFKEVGNEKGPGEPTST